MAILKSHLKFKLTDEIISRESVRIKRLDNPSEIAFSIAKIIAVYSATLFVARPVIGAEIFHL